MSRDSEKHDRERRKRKVQEEMAAAREYRREVQEAAEIPVERDEIQTAADYRVREIERNLQGSGMKILYIAAALLTAAILGFGIYAYNRRQEANARTALGKALEIQNAQVTENPLPDSIAPTYKTEQERANAAQTAFQNVAANYGGGIGEQAKYFIAVNKLTTDRENAVRELETLSKNSGEIGGMAKFALAEAKAAEGKDDEAAALYADLAKVSNLPIAADTINSNIAAIYVKQGKKAEAADIYFNIAKNAREAKDSLGEPLQLSETAREAAEKLQQLDATKYAQLPPEPKTPTLGFGGM